MGEKRRPRAAGADGPAAGPARRRPGRVPRLELVGDGELRVENHKGILAYGDEEIQVSGGVFLIQIRGSGLELRAMTGLELLITGRIDSIQLH